ncbi:MAG: PEP-CTERM sorting domain-containing protein [Sedimentisphaerales bacterium]
MDSGPFEGAVGFDLKEADTGNSPFLPGGTLVDNITLGSNGTGQIDLELRFDETSAGGPLQLMDTQVFNMVPEPMTMVLLGLGGLFLRRRR